MELYRIISLEAFIDLLHHKRERYVRPSTWEDVFEGYLFSKIYDPIERRKIVEDIYYTICPRNYQATIENMLRLEHSKWFVYGQCWSTEAESDAMWRIYSYGKHSIQIQTTKAKIEHLFDDTENIKHIIEPIKYDIDPADDLTQKQIQQLKSTLSIYEPYLHKRKAFSHENEIRVLVDDSSYFQMTEMSMMGANWKIYETMKQKKNDQEVLEEILSRLDNYMDKWNTNNLPNSVYIENIDLKEYVSAVVVNPFAEEWYVDLIKGLCEEYEISCLGQSQLYKINITKQ